MFGIFRDRKTKNARQLFEMACKVYNYRKDVIAEQDAKNLEEMIKQLDELILDGKVGTQEYEGLAQKLEALMKKCGGRIYPTSSWSDNVDTIIVVGIVALGIRSFFLQPFKIPTNSMYPSFYGMTAEAYAPGEDALGIGEKIARFALKGASNYSLEAPVDGDLLLEINAPQAARFRGGFINFEEKNVRKYFGIWPTRERQYIFEVGGKKLELNLPADFSLDTVIAKALPIGDAKNIIEYLNAAHDKKMITSKDGKIYINYGPVKRGDRVINFDILSGDMLFVDRFTYNFKKPKVGDSIVFLTKYCDGMTAMNNGVPDDKYYIKRRRRIEGRGGYFDEEREAHNGFASVRKKREKGGIVRGVSRRWRAVGRQNGKSRGRPLLRNGRQLVQFARQPLLGASSRARASREVAYNILSIHFPVGGDKVSLERI